jgi:flavin reductase (DIM6/NTAB) family NADH-FMN oxidoreductase RutF/rubredoxin
MSYGVYVISSKLGDKVNGQIANAAMQVTSDPPKVAVALNKENLTHDFIKTSAIFTLCVLAEDTPMVTIGLFGFKSGRDVDKFSEIPCEICSSGCPVLLEHSLGHFEAEVVHEVDLGTHTLFVGEVVGAKVLREGEPMTYAYYHQVKRGKTPKTAPTFVATPTPLPEKEESAMKKYVCSVCGYVYDPEKGDSASGIPGGVAFEDLPEDWVCPVCGAGKDEFEPEE